MQQKAHDLFCRIFMDARMKDQKVLISKCENDEHCDVDQVILDNFSDLDISKSVCLSSDFHRDIEFDSVFRHLDQTELKGSSHILRQLFECPSNDVGLLRKRQECLKEFGEHDDREFQKLKELESSVLWALTEPEEGISDLFNMMYFKLALMKKLNGCPEVLTGVNLYKIIFSPLVGILAPVIYFIVPYLVIWYSFGINISFRSYIKLLFTTMMNSGVVFGMAPKFKLVQGASYLLSMIFYFTGLFNSVEIAKTLYKVGRHLCGKVDKIAEFLKVSVEVIGKHWTEKMGDAFGGAVGCLSIEEELAYVRTLSFGPFKLLSNFGKHLVAYKSLHVSTLKSILKKVYVIDCVRALGAMRNKFNYGYTEYMTAEQPNMKLSGLRHPCIADAVPNDVSMGGKVPNNIIITGTNAGGKSVTIKGILINALMSQTCGVSCCDACAMTVFDSINAQINVPDSTGHESLFEAEMHRCKATLDGLRDNSGKNLVVMDEIFSSTNPLEAICGAYAVCNKIASFKNSMLIFTTHYNYLTKLSKLGGFVNYKMETLVGNDTIEFTYKLVRGVNKHHLALELLKRNGFDQDIIDAALAVKKKISA